MCDFSLKHGQEMLRCITMATTYQHEIASNEEDKSYNHENDYNQINSKASGLLLCLHHTSSVVQSTTTS